MRKTYEDVRGNERCLVCHSKIEGGYCDCIAYEIQNERNQKSVKCYEEIKDEPNKVICT